MRVNRFAVAGTLAMGLAVLISCGNPSRPSVSMVVGKAASPANNVQLGYGQPVTLTVANGVTTGKSSPTFTFEVATDSGFSTKVFTKNGVPQGSGGSTSVSVDSLQASTTYFWRAQLVTDGQGGPYSAVQSFKIGPPIIIQAPTPVSPASGGTSSGVLTVNNSSVSGPAGPLTYRFDVSGSQKFDSIAFTTVVPEGGSGQTSVSVPSTVLVNQATYYWRAEAMDQTNGVTSPESNAQSFQFVGFDMTTAHIYDSPSDLGSWPQTATITSASTSGPYIDVDFDKRDGPNRWPDEPFGSGTIEYTLGMCLNISGQWDCSAVVQFWFGRDLDAGGNVNQVGLNWFYDQRWGPMIGHQPAIGELVGLFVGSGNLRDRNAPGFVECPTVCERSNVVLIPWGTNYQK